MLSTSLVDTRDETKRLNINVQMENGNLALVVSPEGYGHNEMDDTGPILLELHEGRLRLVIWDDINHPEPIIVDMEKARIANRKETA